MDSHEVTPFNDSINAIHVHLYTTVNSLPGICFLCIVETVKEFLTIALSTIDQDLQHCSDSKLIKSCLCNQSHDYVFVYLDICTVASSHH